MPTTIVKAKEAGLTGNLNTVPLSDLFQLISVSGKTGMLSIWKETCKREIYFKQGGIVYATSTGSDDELLGNLLLSRRKILKPDLQKALSLQKLTQKRLGTILFEMRVLTQEEMVECLQYQIEEIIYSLFGWSSGEFTFYDGRRPPTDEVTVQLNTMNVIMEGSKRIDEWTLIKETLPADNLQLRVVKNPKVKSASVTVTVDELQLLPLINGERTIPELLSVSPLNEFFTYKALFHLISSGWIEVGETKKVKRQAADEEKLILDVLIRLYSLSYQAVERVASQKLGEGAKTILKRCLDVQKSLNPLIGRLESSDSFMDFRSLRGYINRFSQAVQFHKLVDALDDLLLEFMKAILRSLGRNVAQQLTAQIKKDLSQAVAEQRWISKEYELEEEIFKTLRQSQRCL
ncbi:MAG: DUF4388 domain-containing protein [Candidatus Zixiibacteriota bacterium]